MSKRNSEEEVADVVAEKTIVMEMNNVLVDAVAVKKKDISIGKEEILVKELFSNSLGESTVVYARNTDVKDTFIVRNLFPKTFKAFGVKGYDNIRKTFLAITMLLDNPDVLCSLKYGTAEKLAPLL